MPVVRVPSVLRRFTAGGAEVRADGATARAALMSLCAQFPELRIRLFDKKGAVFPYLLLFKNDAPAALDTPLASDDTLEVIAAVEGG